MTQTDAGEGLRERKRRQTRERITEAARVLFLERGFDAVTVEAIAAAADVSKRSFFDYFPSKEDVVAAWQDGFGTRLAAAVAARPPGEPLGRVAEEALLATLLPAMMDPAAAAFRRLIRETPALRARDHLKYATLEQILAAALAARVDGEAERLQARLLAMMVTGALRIGGEAWRAKGPFGSFGPNGMPAEGQGGTEDPEAAIRAMFTQIWAALRELAK